MVQVPPVPRSSAAWLSVLALPTEQSSMVRGLCHGAGAPWYTIGAPEDFRLSADPVSCDLNGFS